MELRYDIKKYITKIKMSTRTVLLVEGKDDRAHIKNLLNITLGTNKIKIDTAENIKGDCSETSKNNRAKIDKIFSIVKDKNDCRNLFLLCDREYRKFRIEQNIIDDMIEHESDGNLSWTIGHSIENYFITKEIVMSAYRFLCGSYYKNEALEIFSQIYDDAIKIVVALSLASKEINSCSFPIGKVNWKLFHIEKNAKNFTVSFDEDAWKKQNTDDISIRFLACFTDLLEIAELSDMTACERVARGHTSIIMLQRLFSFCLFYAATEDNALSPEKDANEFSNIKESNISSALCESWLSSVKSKNASYPKPLIECLAYSESQSI
ncbi:hypothetical protein [Aeromonas enteropelogenes]|uniref:hypothetical protein n=1 Tax=Aeromonas enteropelogenes TaxID=29489 RepID=UPI003987946C